VTRGVKFDKNRDNWCTYLNFNMIYNDIYSLMAETGIATKLDTACYFDKSWQTVESKDEAYGRKSEYMLMHPEKFFFVDEVGSNTSQGGDGHCGGKYSWCQITSSPKFVLQCCM